MLVFVIFTGCTKPLMVTPTIFAPGEVDPFFELHPDQRSSEQTLFFATDRIEEHPGWGNFGRQRSDVLSLGTCRVQYDGAENWQLLSDLATGNPGLDRPVMRLKKTTVLGWLDSPRTVVAVEGEPPPEESSQPFINAVQAALDRSSQHEITIFIHGFKNGFGQAINTTAEFSHYAGNQGVFIAYTWPSYNSLWQYSHDRDSARFTASHARELIALLAERTDAHRINIMCHSTGAQIVGTVLRELRLMTYDLPAEEARQRFRIGQIFMIAPDIDLDVARERVMEEGAGELFDHLTVYASKRDLALNYARTYLYGLPRLGLIGDTSFSEINRALLERAPMVTVIDIDNRPTRTALSHSHQRFNPTVSSDILLCLRRDLTHEQRGLVQMKDTPAWQFADDYEQRIMETARDIYPLLER